VASITAVVDNTYGSVTVTLDYTSVSAATGFGVCVSLTRTTPDGVVTAVRGSPALLSSAVATFVDTEMPINTLITYTSIAPCVTGTVLTLTGVIVTGSGQTLSGFLKDPISGVNDIPLVPLTALRTGCETVTGIGLTGFDAETLDTASGVFPIIGDPRPRTIAQVRKDISSTLYLATTQHSDILSLRRLLATGRVLCLQLNTALGWALDRYGTDYIIIDDVVLSRVDSPDMRHTQRYVTLPFHVVYAPANFPILQYGGNNTGLRGASWGKIKAAGTLWNQEVTTPARDRFDRVTANGWGTADVGGVWATSGGIAGDYATNTGPVPGSWGTATMTLTSVNVARRTTLPVGPTNVNGYYTFSYNALAVGAGNYVQSTVRDTASTDNYRFRVQVETSGALTALIGKVVAGTPTTIVTTTVPGITYAANVPIRVRFYCVSNVLQMKVWPFNTPEPTAWLLSTTDAAFAGAGNVGLGANINAAGTAPRTATFWDFLTEDVSASKTWLTVAQGG
jgi:hypothetical protein